jgi:hypothetical protein
MNILQLVGAAVSCKDFCELLFDDPVQAAQLLGITLTQADVATLKEAFCDENRDQVCSHLDQIRAMICKRPPCPLAPVIPGRDTCGDMAA